MADDSNNTRTNIHNLRYRNEVLKLKLVISIIAYRKINGTTEFLIQKRTNTGTPEWFGLWEFPQGKLSDSSVVELAKFKFNNETNMVLKKMQIFPGQWINCDSPPDIDFYSPIIVTNAKDDYAMHFFGVGQGEYSDTDHATNHTWMNLAELQALIKESPESICPLNKPAIEALFHSDLTMLYK